MNKEQRVVECLRSLRPTPGGLIENAANRIEYLERILGAILDADERGQGQPFKEAMDAAHNALGRDNP